MKKTALFAMFLSGLVFAKDLGVHGELFEIKEESLLENIQKKLLKLESSGDILKHQKIIQKRVQEKIENPPSVPGLQKATSYRSYFYDPSIVVPYDIKDLKRNIIARAGEKVNPLASVSLQKPLLFIDGSDEKQVSWAIKQMSKQRSKIILVSGKPLELRVLYNEKFYFDQGGILTKKFDLRAVPARVSQSGFKLLVEEIVMEEGR
ncbi:MAG TPA: type-F conjugative transfer system protein TraW [Alphaproteobacteria bacterium]|nr:type-F conjugative transfer system protein TraW [Alphaproteobacteria bacterium]